MLFVALLQAASASESPDEPPSIERMAEAALAGLAGGTGCTRLVGEIEQENRAGVFGKTSIRATFEGELRAGLWSGVTGGIVEAGNARIMVGSDIEGGHLPFLLPMFGSFRGVGEGSMAAETRSLFGELLGAMETSVETESVRAEVVDGAELLHFERWMGSGWNLFRGRQDNSIHVWLEPRGEGKAQARRWHVIVEDPVRREGKAGRLVRLDAELHVDPDGVPRSESVTLRGALGPFVLDVTRRIAYVRTGCATGS